MSSLRRTQAGCYGLDRAVTLERLLETEDPASLLLPVDSLFANLPAVTVPAAQLTPIYNGAAVKTRQPDGRYRVYGPDGTFLLVGQAEQGRLKPVKSFFEVVQP